MPKDPLRNIDYGNPEYSMLNVCQWEKSPHRDQLATIRALQVELTNVQTSIRAG